MQVGRNSESWTEEPGVKKRRDTAVQMATTELLAMEFLDRMEKADRSEGQQALECGKAGTKRRRGRLKVEVQAKCRWAMRGEGICATAVRLYGGTT